LPLWSKVKNEEEGNLPTKHQIDRNLILHHKGWDPDHIKWWQWPILIYEQYPARVSYVMLAVAYFMAGAALINANQASNAAQHQSFKNTEFLHRIADLQKKSISGRVSAVRFFCDENNIFRATIRHTYQQSIAQTERLNIPGFGPDEKRKSILAAKFAIKHTYHNRDCNVIVKKAVPEAFPPSPHVKVHPNIIPPDFPQKANP
jgi:hypothetical protein